MTTTNTRAVSSKGNIHALDGLSGSNLHASGSCYPQQLEPHVPTQHLMGPVQLASEWRCLAPSTMSEFISFFLVKLACIRFTGQQLCETYLMGHNSFPSINRAHEGGIKARCAAPRGPGRSTPSNSLVEHGFNRVRACCSRKDAVSCSCRCLGWYGDIWSVSRESTSTNF